MSENDRSLVLDPFAGTGTVPLTAGRAGRPSVGIEIMPVGVRLAQAIRAAADSVEPTSLKSAADAMLNSLTSNTVAYDYAYPHVPITENAFPTETEQALAQTRRFLSSVDDPGIRLILDVACMGILEEVSYTSKDGQYLRWDARANRKIASNVNKGRISSFGESLQNRLDEIVSDSVELRERYRNIPVRIILGSAFTELSELSSESVGLTITSPPYANRYDYTRIYALELAWLGYDRSGFNDLRQSLLSATVENRPKTDQIDGYPRRDVLANARAAVSEQTALSETIEALSSRRSELSNPYVIRLLTEYFNEMALMIAELFRLTSLGGRVVMVNDNVSYHGQDVPVDLILSDIAERCGFYCEEISVLSSGKGNSSQQMSRFGRSEQRKCVYSWVKPGGESTGSGMTGVLFPSSLKADRPL